MAQVGIEQLLEAGVHFGHQTRRWNPKMRRFIFGERDGIYLIDLIKTAGLLADAQQFASDLARRGGVVLFVGTKKQARDAIQEVAEGAGMPYVNHRWLGGLLTNFQTMSQRIRRLHDLERYEREGQLELLPTRERMAAQADLAKLRANLGGVKNMQRVPDAVFVVDLKTEAIAVREAQRLRVPVIGLVDTNCDPDGVDFVIPGNDDAIRSCSLVTKAIGDVVSESFAVFRAEEERARKEAEEKAKREAEERAKREAEERAKREAEEQAKREAEQAKREEEEQAKREQAQREAAEAAFAAHKAAQAAAAGKPAPPPPKSPTETAPAETQGSGSGSAKPAPEAPAAAPADAPAASADAPAEAPDTPAASADVPAEAPADTPVASADAPAEAQAQTPAAADPAPSTEETPQTTAEKEASA